MMDVWVGGGAEHLDRVASNSLKSVSIPIIILTHLSLASHKRDTNNQ